MKNIISGNRRQRLIMTLLFLFTCFASFAHATGNIVWSAYQNTFFSGNYSYSYKINLPLGTNRLTPNLSLSYKSILANNQPDWIGAGWEITQSYFQTNTDNTFSLFLNGAKHDLLFVAADGRYHTKIETNLKIEKKTGTPNEKGSYWTAFDTNGTEYRFGANLDSENMLTTSDPAVTPGVWRWSLDRIRDANGNCIYYSYMEDRGAVYPSRIEYNNDRQRVIEFVLEDRPDPYQTVEEGSEISVAKRLSRINVSVSGSLVKSFKLDYAPLTTEITQSLLTAITKQGSDGSSLPPTTFSYKPYAVEAGKEWLLEKVMEDLGGTTSVAYAAANTYPNTQFPFDYWVVSAITRDNGLPVGNSQHTASTTGFAYDQGLFDTPSNEFRGFGQVTETRPDGGKVVHTYHQDDAKKGKEAQTVVADAAGNPYAGSVNTWSATSANGVYTVNLDRVEAFTYDGKAGNPKQTLTEYAYDAYGNVTQEARSGDVAMSGDELLTVSEYVYNPPSWIMDKVKHVYSVASSGGPHLRESWFNYDGQADLNMPPVAGNLTREEAFLDTGENPVTTHEYDIYGNRIKTTDPEKRVTTVKYDDILHTFPVEVTNAKKQTTVREFNPANGQPTMVKDPNGFVTTYKYDAFNRLSKEIKPGDSETYPSSEIIYFLDGTAPESVKVLKREKSGTSNTLDAFQFVDGLGRLIQTKTEYKNTANWIALDVYYDAMGRDYKHTNPYLTDPSTDYSTPLSVAATVTEYDSLGRAIKTTNPDSTFASTVYDHWTVTSTDENDHSKTRSYDANKNLVQVVESNHVGVNGSALTSIDETYTTDYLYNPLGELLQTRNHFGNTVSYLYDTLGRKVTAIDPDQGRKDFVYDLVGNLTRQSDARGVITKFLYDPLNRTLQVIYPKDKGVQYQYDLETIGTLSQVTDALGTVAYKYDNRLRKVREDRAMDAMTWTSKWDYDALDRVVSQTYPDGNQVGFTYNTMGKLDGIPTILSSIDYNERGLEVRRNYANGLGTVFDYNPLNQRLTKITTVGIQDFTYGYDNVGNVQSIANAGDAANQRTETFTYDDLDRLVNAEDSGLNGYRNTYNYNAIGNMLSETDAKYDAIVSKSIASTSVATYTYGLGSAGPHAVTGKSDTKPVIGIFSLNNGKAYSTTQAVTLNNIAMGYPTEYLASEKADFSDATWQTYSTNPTFNLSSGFGPKSVYFKVRNANGETSVKSGDIQFLLDSSGKGIPDVYNSDLDNDGIPDAWEIAHGIDQTVPGHALLVNASGLTNQQAYQYGTNPNKVDTDDDGWSDYDEIFVYHTNPNSNGFDNVRDGSSENYSLRLGRFNQGGNLRSSSSYQVSDALGKTTAQYDLIDTDGDGIPDIIGPDADNNGIPDTWERAHGIDMTVPGHAQLDPDFDGLTNLQEYRRGTNPNKTDTDGDGLSDYAEAYVYHSDPTNTINSFQPVGSESYSLKSAAFTMGGWNRSGDTTNISDRIGSQVSSTVLVSNSNVSVIPTMIDFGVVDASGKLSQLILNNLGNSGVTFGIIKVEGENGLEFATQNDACSNTAIAPSSSCTVSVRFTPAFAGAKDAILRISTDDPLIPLLTVNLTGIAVTVTDSLPPSGSLVINSGAVLTNSRTVELTLSATDVSGVSQMCISNTSVCENREVFSIKKAWVLTEGDGVKSLFVWFRDYPGNANLTPFSGTITLDTAKPIVTATPKGGIYAVGQTITLTSNKPGLIYYSKDGRNPTTASQMYSGALTVGSNSALKFYSVDPAGNQGDVKSEVYLIGTPSVLTDSIVPIVTAFTMPTTANNLIVPVSMMTATDNVAVTGFLITETATIPPAEAISWSATVPTSYTFVTQGSKTLYAWAKDETGNISNSLSANVTINLTDTAVPTVAVFTMPLSSNSLTVPVSTLTATDDYGVTGYLLSETASQPLADNLAWTTSVPISYTFTTQGVKTLYAFAKDSSGNVSVPLSASVTIKLLDTTAPTVTAFTVPPTANSLTVPVSTLTATDDVAVTGYLLTVTASQPQANNPAWTTSVPVLHTFATQGVKTLYAFTKDAAGNISVPRSTSVTILLSDTTAPTVTGFTMPTTANSLTVPVATLTATDDVAVSSYLLTETANQPQADNPAWIASVPASHTFVTQGVKTLYVFAKDAAGNISAPLSASVRITLSDIIAPTVTAFTIPATGSDLNVPISSLTATDTVGVTGYLLSETSNQPQANDPIWSATIPTSYTFTTQGAKILYAFAKDAAGNISSPLSASVTISLGDTTAPTVTAFTLPATSTSLTVPVSSLTATDTVGVTGYLLSETATISSVTDTHWTTTPTSSYTFANAGAKTLYAWAKDAAGNVSAAAFAAVTISLTDITAPTVNLFAMPTTATSLTLAVTALTATDDVAVTGYLLRESATPPQPDNPAWTSTPPTSYTLASQGSKTIDAFAKDAAGNVSAPLSATVTITLPDTSAPTVTVFSIPATASSLTVPALAFAATDNVAVTGYYLSESIDLPSPADPGWTSTTPSSYTFITAGSKNLYAFAKDAAGNISPPASCSTNIITTSTTQFTVTPTTGIGFTISPAIPQIINNNGTTSFNVTPASGYGIASVSGCVGSISGTTYTTGPITTNCTISVTAVARNAIGGNTAKPTLSDALKVLQAVVGITPLTATEQIRYDVAPLAANGVPLGNGVLDASDVIAILRRSIGIGSW